MKGIVVALGIFLSSLVSAVQEVNTKVDQVRIYSGAGESHLDMPVILDASCPSGSSFYIEKTGDYETTVSTLLTALSTNKEVSVAYDSGYKPNFTSLSSYCRIYSVGVSRN